MKLFRERYNYELNGFMRMLGVTRVCESSIEFKWGYVSFGGGPELQLDHAYSTGIPRLCFCPFFIAFHVELPFLKQRYEDINHSPQYGLHYYGKVMWWHWGLETYAFHMPWDWEHVSHTVLTEDGWVPAISQFGVENGQYEDGRIVEVHPYVYRLKSGEVQNRKAEVYLESREWRWRWFQWLPFPRKVRTSINIDFDGEVGERSGSWKGGVTGCGYEIKAGEAMHECLKRMETEREFT